MEEWARNGSGYYDDTAYKAIKELDRKGESNMFEYRRGDVIEYDTPTGKHILAVVVSNDKYNIDSEVNVVNTCALTEKKISDLCVPFMLRDKKYINCGALGNVYKSRHYEIVKELSDEEMEAVDEALLKTFDLMYSTVKDDERERGDIREIGELRDEIERLNKEKKELFDKSCNYEYELKKLGENESGSDELVRAMAERDVYKELYMKAMNL